MAVVRSPEKKTPVAKRHIMLSYGQVYMKQDMKYVLFKMRQGLLWMAMMDDGPMAGLGLVLSYITVSGAINEEVV